MSTVTQPPNTGTFKQIDAAEVAKHNTKGNLWIVVDSLIYDLSKFAAL